MSFDERFDAKWTPEPVTIAVNTMRGDGISAKNKDKSHCKRGHPLSGPNVLSRGDRPGGRECWTCARDAKLRYRFKNNPDAVPRGDYTTRRSKECEAYAIGAAGFALGMYARGK